MLEIKWRRVPEDQCVSDKVFKISKLIRFSGLNASHSDSQLYSHRRTNDRPKTSAASSVCSSSIPAMGAAASNSSKEIDRS